MTLRERLETPEPNCLFCGKPQVHSGAHFDGSYYTCDPEAACNQPGYDYEKDPMRQ